MLLLGTLGCAAQPKRVEPPPPPKPPEDPWSWVPEDAALTGRVALEPLRNTPLWPLWTELEREQGLASWVDVAKVARLTFGGRGQRREDASYVAALEGSFREDELRALAERDQVVAEPRGLLTVYRRPDAVWTQITPRLIVVATPDRLDALVARASAGPGAAIKQTPLYLSLAQRVELETAHLAAIAQEAEGQDRASLERRANRYGLGGVARDAVRVGVGLEVGPEYRLVGVAEATDAARAQALEANVRESLDALSGNFLLRMLGVSGLVSRLRVASDGSYVVVRGQLPEVEVSQLLQRVQGAFSVAQSAGGAP